MLNWWLKYKTKKALKKTVRERFFLNWSEIHTILLLIDARDSDDVELFINYLKDQNKTVKTLAYKDKKNTQSYSPILYTIISDKEVYDWTGKAIANIIDLLNEEKYDLVIDLTLERYPTMEYILASSEAPLKAGYKKAELQLPLYDLTIASLPEPEESEKSPKAEESEESEKPERRQVKPLAREIVHYLSTISSKA